MPSSPVQYANGEHKAAFESSYNGSQWRSQFFWQDKPLTPAQLLIHDVRVQRPSNGHPTRLSIDEVPASSLVPTTDTDAYLRTLPESGIGANTFEAQRIAQLREDYGWFKWLRGEEGVSEPLKCRWIHISSKLPQHLEGVFVGLSDWSTDPERKLERLRQLNTTIPANERWSKHGNFFSAFSQPLDGDNGGDWRDQSHLLSIPFLDWTVYPGPIPPLRFQVDEREGYASSRAAVHPLRSILQHKYRLEDTSDREKSQVYSRHKPWKEDRNMDLKVRRFYGQYPSGLNVDELWVLIVDDMHTVTFSSNQTWKARWPPLQLSSRIAEISFRGLRKHQFVDPDTCNPYNSFLHAVVCLNGAVGLVHRSFWTDAPLPCSERYAAQLGRLQYRLYRAPSTKLVLDLLQLQDELAIIEDITKSQIETILRFEQHLANKHQGVRRRPSLPQQQQSSVFLSAQSDSSGIVGRLRGELQDLSELRTSTNDLVNRTVQLVNIKLEDHGQAILTFTIVTVVFLPLSFLTSFFGMNVADIRNMATSQWIFWACAGTLTTAVVGASTFLAFYGARLNEKFKMWRDAQTFDPGLNIRERWLPAQWFNRNRPEIRPIPTANAVRGPIKVLHSTSAANGRDWDLGLAAP